MLPISAKGNLAISCHIITGESLILPGLLESLPVRFLPLTVHDIVPFRPTFAPSGIGIVFQILIKLPIVASLKVSEMLHKILKSYATLRDFTSQCGAT